MGRVTVRVRENYYTLARHEHNKYIIAYSTYLISFVELRIASLRWSVWCHARHQNWHIKVQSAFHVEPKAALLVRL